MLPNREGRFKASILDHGVSETGPNKLVTFVCQYRLVSELENGEWMEVTEDFDITGYHYLEKRDSSINQVTVSSLRRAFGWDGRDPIWLQDTDMSGLLVQVKLGFEKYNDKPRIKVQFVDSGDAVPRDVPKADDNLRQAINTRLGAKFRAMAAGSPSPVPKPTAARPPASRPAPVKPAAPATPGALAEPAQLQATMEQAWAEFTKHCVDRDGRPRSPEDTEAEWFAAFAQLFPGKQPDQFSPVEWGVMLAEGPSQIIPF